jgi:NADH-quinone oxidoreductase subunit L
MEPWLQFFILLPILTFIVGAFIPNSREKRLSSFVIISTGLHLITLLFFIGIWLFNNAPTLNIKHITLYHENTIEIFIDFYFDIITAVYALMGAILTFIIVVFSKYYLHRDSGFKRYFNTLILFYLGYNLVVFSGNFETLFIGWELIGISSFLLISFYRDRYLPVKNGLKTISLYRLGDICLILALWMSHHLWHQNITFLQLNNSSLVLLHIEEHTYFAIFILLMLVIAAALKSAQLPFSSWLPRAMEGPTTSSAIFYGSLSVHLGVFLLLRTYPYWQSVVGIKVLIICIGLFTTIITTCIARVQASVKSQIAYSSIAQLGIMFIEVALGLHALALFHFAGNAFLRTYQILVSPSVLGYKIHNQFFESSHKPIQSSNLLKRKFANSIYILSLKEWNLDAALFRFLWIPFKRFGKRLSSFKGKFMIITLSIIYAIGFVCFLFEEKLPKQFDEFLHLFFAGIGMILILKAFVERKSASTAWLLVITSQFFQILSIAMLNDKYEYLEILIYISGLLVSAIVGFICLNKIQKLEQHIDLNGFKGHIHEHPKTGFVFLLACLGFVGLPFTPSFIGIDLMFSHIHKHEYLLIIFTSISFLFIEIAVLRIYGRLFLGPHIKKYHPIAYQSS